VRLWLQLEAGLGPDAQLLMLSSRFHLARAGGTLWRRQRESLVPSDPVGLYVYDEAFNDICVREFVPPGWYDPPPRTAADDRRDGVADEVFPSEPRQKEDVYALLSSDWVNQARAWLSRNLRDLAALLRLPSSDSCTIITVEPATWQDDYGFLYRQHRFRGYLLAPLPAIQSRPEVWTCLQNKNISMTDFSRHDTQILKIDSARHLLEEALAWPPIYLYDPEQWGNYAAQTWRRPLYVPCGAWRKMLAEPAPAKPASVNPVCSPPTSPRLIALWRGTRRRQHDRDANHQKLFKIAKPIWAAMLAEPGPPARGRPAHKRRLVELLAERGIHVSGRPLRRLMAALKLTTE
jgi:hypothetical protein